MISDGVRVVLSVDGNSVGLVRGVIPHVDDVLVVGAGVDGIRPDRDDCASVCAADSERAVRFEAVRVEVERGLTAKVRDAGIVLRLAGVADVREGGTVRGRSPGRNFVTVIETGQRAGIELNDESISRQEGRGDAIHGHSRSRNRPNECPRNTETSNYIKNLFHRYLFYFQCLLAAPAKILFRHGTSQKSFVNKKLEKNFKKMPKHVKKRQLCELGKAARLPCDSFFLFLSTISVIDLAKFPNSVKIRKGLSCQYIISRFSLR